MALHSDGKMCRLPRVRYPPSWTLTCLVVPLDRRAHWRATVRRILVLLAIWALVGPVMSILFVEQLNTLTIAGTPLGFWMGQQGSIYVFVVLIFVNAWMADRLDRRGEEGPAAGGWVAGVRGSPDDDLHR
jgi:putative solute:sodium symporter small subunit